MSYVEDNLLPDEKIIARASIHWAAFVPGTVLFFIGLIISVFVLVAMANAAEADPVNGQTTAGLMLFCCLCPLWAVVGLEFVRVAMIFFTTEFAVTSKRIIAKRGGIRQQSLELRLNKVESVAVKEPLVGRLFGYGTIVVSGSGGTHQSFPNIADPGALRNKINAILSRLP